jgi:hypothetical protein
MENNKEMTPQEALTLLAQVAALYKGNLQEHTALQEAVKTLNGVIQPKQTDTSDKK